MQRATLLGLTCFLLVLPATGTPPTEGPTYASPRTERLISQMIEAHGGLGAWRAASTISFDHNLLIPGPDMWMVKHEVVDRATRHTYQDWPLFGARLTWDGQQTWTQGWPRGMMPPTAAVYSGFVPVNIVWLTQDDGVTLGDARRGTFPGDPAGSDTEYHIIRMQYAGGDDYYDLYIHPETHLLRGFETIVTYGGLLDSMGLPPEVTFWGPMYHNFRAYVEVGGLIFPAQWNTQMVRDGREIGKHLVLNHRLDAPFDRSRLRKPADAVVDTSTKERKQR